MDRVILHSDMNNFYASVECILNPALHGRPVAVAGDPQQRHGIVLAKNQQAKLCGVQTGNPLWLARRLCPDIVFVPPHMDLYVEYAHAAREIYYAYTSQVEPFGLDESWLDVTGSACLFGDGRTVADEIRARIKRELGVSVSIGVSFNKVFAKLGSDLHKPDATTVIGRAQMRQTVWPLPVESLLYVGRATHRRLRERGATEPVIFLSAKGDIVDKGVKQDGTENTTAITPYQFWSNNYSSKVSEANVFDATFVKLREMVLSYQMPQRWFKNCFIGSLALGVEGRNLWLMKSNVPHIDPETNIFGPSAVGSGVEYSAIPTTRSWGFNIKLTF